MSDWRRRSICYAMAVGKPVLRRRSQRCRASKLRPDSLNLQQLLYQGIKQAGAPETKPALPVFRF